ncbi:MAG: cytochrome c maturation protein CcmE [Chloroflexota bacterium]
MKKNGKFLIGGIILFLVIGYLGFIGFQRSATYYYTVGEFIQQGDAVPAGNVKINGQVAPDSVVREAAGRTLKFTITEGGGSLPVIYQGAVPDTFSEGVEVVVEGRLGSDGIFQAKSILTKCPSKYVPE